MKLISYYLIKSLNGAEKAVLLNDLLIKLHGKSINVTSVTFDGDEGNQKTCKVLEAKFNCNNKETFKPYFQHPVSKKPMYCFFDPCHMLKLVRNYFATNGPIMYDRTDEIDWNYIKKLNKKQYDEEMHCTCKFKNRYVFFKIKK